MKDKINTKSNGSSYTQDQIIDKLSSQKETIKMADSLSRRELTFFEKLAGSISAILIYGIGFALLFYMLINIKQW